MNIAWSGQHTRGKALNVLIAALALLKLHGKLGNVHVSVLGAGSRTLVWKKKVLKCGLSGVVSWYGWRSRDEAVAIVSQADVFAITSLRDLTSTVLLEALSHGKPVICLDHCGFSDIVDETCGIKIPVGRAREVIQGFADAILRLQDQSLRDRLSAGALKRAKEYEWGRKKSLLSSWLKPEWRKLIICSYACSPYRGSEPGMGWNYLKIVAEGREVWVVIEEEKWRMDIERYLREHPIELENVHWVFVRKFRARMLRKLWPPSYYWFYRLWQLKVYGVACKLHRVIKFDAAYQMNMVTFREPGYLWKLPIPFIWGPVGGLGYMDMRLWGLMDFRGSTEYLVRNFINWLHCHLMRRPRLAANKAASTGILMAATSENKREMKKLWDVDAKIMCEIGV